MRYHAWKQLAKPKSSDTTNLVTFNPLSQYSDNSELTQQDGRGKSTANLV